MIRLVESRVDGDRVIYVNPAHIVKLTPADGGAKTTVWLTLEFEKMIVWGTPETIATQIDTSVSIV